MSGLDGKQMNESKMIGTVKAHGLEGVFAREKE